MKERIARELEEERQKKEEEKRSFLAPPAGIFLKTEWIEISFFFRLKLLRAEEERKRLAEEELERERRQRAEEERERRQREEYQRRLEEMRRKQAEEDRLRKGKVQLSYIIHNDRSDIFHNIENLPEQIKQHVWSLFT